MKPRLYGMLLAAVILGGAALRLLYVRELQADPSSRHLELDAEYHDYWAQALLTGDWTPPAGNHDPAIGRHPYVKTPGYPYFLALVYRVVGRSYTAARLAQMGLGLVSIGLLFLLGRTLWGGRVGWIAATLMAGYWVFPYYEAQFLEPVLVIPLALGAMLCLLDNAARPRTGCLAAAGLLLGLLAWARPNILLFLPLAALWVGWRAGRIPGGRWAALVAPAGLVLCAALAVLPVTLRNFMVSGELVPVTAGAGLNLHLGNNPLADGYTGIAPDVKNWTTFDYPALVARLGREQGRSVTYSEASALYAAKARAFIREDPGRFLRLILKKTLLFWGPLEISVDKVDECERAHSRVLRLGGLRFPHILALALLGFILYLGEGWRGAGGSAPDAREEPAGEATRAGVVLIAAFILIYFASYLPFTITGRYRVPLIPFLLLFGAYGLERLLGYARRRAWRRLMGAGLLGLLLLGLTSANPACYAPDPAKWHYARGLACARDGDLPAAECEFRTACALAPGFVPAIVKLGRTLQEQGRTDAAVAEYRRAAQLQPDYAETYDLWGTALSQAGRGEEAVRVFSRGLQADADAVGVRLNLGRTLAAQGDLAAAIHHFQHVLAIEPDHLDALFDLGHALHDLGRFPEAEAAFQRVMVLNPRYPGLRQVITSTPAPEPAP